MLALIEVNGGGKLQFDALNNDIQAQLQYVYRIVDGDADYKDMKKFMATFLTKAEGGELQSPEDKAESSRMIKDRGNKAYSKKDFSSALLHFSQSALMGPIDQRKGREVAVALANRSAVHFEMEDW